MGQQGEPHAGGVQRPAGADADVHAHGAAAREPLDVHDLAAVADGQLHVLVRGLVEVLEVRERDLPQRQTARGERGDLPEPEAHVVHAGAVPLQRAPRGERADETVGGGEGERRAAGDLGEGEGGVRVIERGEHGEKPVGGGAGWLFDDDGSRGGG